MEYRITIPRRFAEDRENRALPIGRGRWTRAGYETVLTESEMIDLEADAAHYSDPAGLDLGDWPSTMALVRSARATLRRAKMAREAASPPSP